MSGKKPKRDQAQEALQASRVLLEEGLYRDCISRAYYAMFDAAQALLKSDGYEAGTHKGVLVLLDKHYVKENRMPAEVSQTLRQAFDARQLADYSEDPVPRSDAEDAVQHAERFLERIREHLDRE